MKSFQLFCLLSGGEFQVSLGILASEIGRYLKVFGGQEPVSRQ